MELIVRAARRWSALTLGAVFALSACGGGAGGGIMPGSNSGNNTASTGQLIVKGSIPVTGGPQLFAHRTRLPHAIGGKSPAALSLSTVSVSGTIFQSDASAAYVMNTVNISPVMSGQYSAAVPFSNLAVHNNDWVILNFTGKASNGTLISLGELAGIVNVTANPNQVTLTNQTTLQYEVFAALLGMGSLSTNDLDNNATLPSTIQTAITNSGFTANPLTGLFDTDKIIILMKNLMPTFERDLVITPSKTPRNITIVRNWTNASELNLAANSAGSFAGMNLNVGAITAGIPTIIGGSVGFGGGYGGCGGMSAGVPIHTPDTNPSPVASEVDACVLQATGPITVRNVYGGSLLIGATNNPFDGTGTQLPFTSGMVTQAARAPGSANVSITMGSTGFPVTVNDPVGFAYGPPAFTNPSGFGFLTLQPDYSGTPLTGTIFLATPLAPGSFVTDYFRYNIMSPYSSTNNTITVDTFNPFNIPKANMDLCGGITCDLLTATQPFVITRPFIDGGNKLTYRAWTKGGTASGISQGAGSYTVTVSGAGTATLTSTVATTLLPQQTFLISNSMLPGTVWTVTATDTNNNTYTNSGANSFLGGANVTMTSVPATVQIKSIQLSVPTKSAGSFTFGPIQ